MKGATKRELRRMKTVIEYIATNDPTDPVHARWITDEIRELGAPSVGHSRAVLVSLGTACGELIRVVLDVPFADTDEAQLAFTTVAQLRDGERLDDLDRRVMQIVVTAANHQWKTTAALVDAALTAPDIRIAGAVLTGLVVNLHAIAQAVVAKHAQTTEQE